MMSNCKILQMDEELVCDTPVPFYEMGISCGLPNEMGDWMSTDATGWCLLTSGTTRHC